MKLLGLLRHAKSNRGDSALADFDRPLDNRGRKAARRMGEEMRSLAIAYDLVLVSPARRAVETWEILKSEWRSGFAVREEAQLYGASAEQLAGLVAETEDVVNRLLLVGHNPGLHHLAFDLTQGDTSVPHEQLAAKFPTGALAKIELPIASWADFHGSRGRLARFLRPRDFN